MASLIERYQAAMVLSGVGDALGYKNGSWERCCKGEEILQELKSLGGLSAINVKPPGWIVSDDTVMHLATSEALTKCGNSSQEELFKEIARNYKSCMRDMVNRAPGMTCTNSVHDLHPDRPDWRNGCRIEFNDGGGGCGAAMRAMCIGLRYPRETDLPDLIAVSVESGRMTHHHPTGYLGSLAAALFTAYAIQEKPPREWGAGLMRVLPKAKEYIKAQNFYVEENLENWSYFETRWQKYLADKGLLNGTTDPKPDKLEARDRDRFYNSLSLSGCAGSSGYDAPMIAYDAILQSGKNWKKLCERGMFHGGDSDSTGVMAGCWYGAMYGFEGVPEGNYKYLEYRERLEDEAKKLFELIQGSPRDDLTGKMGETYSGKWVTQRKRTPSLPVRYQAAMLLSGAGDALGYKNGSWEDCSDGSEILKGLRSLGGLSALAVKRPGWIISDGTVMHLATSEALTKCGNSTKEILFKEIARNYKSCMRDMANRSPGMTCTNSVHDLNPDRPDWRNGCRIEFNDGGGGCGAAMRAMCIGLRYPRYLCRVAPVVTRDFSFLHGYVCYTEFFTGFSDEAIEIQIHATVGVALKREFDLPDLIVVSVESGRMTHHHPTGYLGSLAAALFTAYAIQEKPPREWGAGLMRALPKAKEYIKAQNFYVKENLKAWSYFETRWQKYLEAKGLTDGSRDPKPDNLKTTERDKFYKSLSFSGWGGSSGHDAPMIAYDAILQSGKDWKELCKRGMFHGGDSDSTGVIAGCWYGAMYGFEGVPEGNYKSLEYHDRLVNEAIKLYKLAFESQKVY